MKTIYFYRTGDRYGEFSNFAKYPIVIDSMTYATSEHYFQAQKFAGTSHEEAVRNARTPMEAARMGRERRRPLRPDWERVKDEIMLRAVRAKFSQHAALAQLLVSTGDAVLVEHTSNDHYWADGGDGTGRNRLGEILRQVRGELVAGTLRVSAAAKGELGGAT